MKIHWILLLVISYGGIHAQNAAVALIKTGVVVDTNGNGCGDAGDTILFTFTVTNEGTLDLESVVVADPIVSGVTYQMGDTNGDNILDINETWIYTATYLLTPQDIAAGEFVNQAFVEVVSSEGVLIDLSDDDSVLEDDPTVTTYISCVLEIGGSFQKKLNLYPNPTSGLLWYDTDSSVHELTFILFDMQGRVVFREELSRNYGIINIGMLEDATYVGEFVYSEGRKIIKIIKQ